MKIELHLLQSFPPSCLNRDDTNSPKDCEFGGVRRARISSQSLKRAVREDFHREGRLTDDERALRTKRVVDAVVDLLVSSHGQSDRAKCSALVEMVLNSAGFTIKRDGEDAKLQYLLFLPRRNLTNLAKLVADNWSALADAAPQGEASTDGGDKTKKVKSKDKKKAKEDAGDALGKELQEKVATLLFDAAQTPELALFGRMIADKPDHNVDAACQVAHAISTHRVATEFDFYTAVDDLKPRDTTGADMMGTVQFNAACFYRYSVLDLAQLARTLAGKPERDAKLSHDEKAAALKVARTWLEASVRAIPSARQNGSAAFTPPQYILTASRASGAPLSLANAFGQPVRAGTGESEDLMSRSAEALSKHLGDLLATYGAPHTTFRVARVGKGLSVPSQAQEAASLEALLSAIDQDAKAWVAAP